MRIKKIAPVTPANGNIKNSYGTSQTDTYSQEYINKFTDYSTTEQVVGKWIDGKPIYRKAVTGTTQTGADAVMLIDKVDTIVDYNIIVLRNNNNQWHPITATMTNYDSNHACPLYTTISNERLNLYISNANYKGQPYKGWVAYTKTTDTANS